MIGAFRLDLRRSRTLVVWIGLVSVLYVGGITLFYPTVLENSDQFSKMLEVYPKELMAAFGITGSLGDPGVFLNSYVFQFLWPLVAAIAAILLATRPAADSERGFLELPLSTRLPRLRYLAAIVAAQALALAILAAATVGAIVVVDVFIKPDFDWGRLALAGIHAWALGLAIAGVTTFLAVAFLDRGRAGGVSAAILIVMYLLNVLAQLSKDVEWAGRLSAFHYFDVKPLIDTGAYPIGASALFVATAMAGWLLAAVVFRRRDLVA
ncbi:MAG TPA: ABC transporter permease subunit [Candidatus Dormibacteraeota bacterium]|nr:ABC transporter permease subunit [Candidatus Dormibacteraeota bacterium]